MKHEQHVEDVKIELLRHREISSPLTLSSLLRSLVFFVNEDLTEDPQRASGEQVPHLKGHFANRILSKVYEEYCSVDSYGFVSEDAFRRFITGTHLYQFLLFDGI